MPPDLQKLRDALNLCVQKREDGNRSASIAHSRSGKRYTAGRVQSDTHLLDIPSEQAVLALSVHHNDFGVYRIVTITEERDGALVSPLVLKILIDHTARTGVPISYTLLGGDGAVFFETKDARASCPLYQPAIVPLKKINDRAPETNKIKVPRGRAARHCRNSLHSRHHAAEPRGIEPMFQRRSDEIQTKTFSFRSSLVEIKRDSDTAPLNNILKRCALLGMEHNFPTRDGASGYGAAVATKNGMIYFGGQYSSFEKRSGLHAEMAVITAALMDGATDITHIGIISSKYPDTPCPPCGCCRQFMMEIFQKYSISPVIYAFAKESDVFKEYSMEELLPDRWTNANSKIKMQNDTTN